MTAYLSPVPKLQFIDANGVPVAGGKLYSYAAGTTTPLATYTDSSGTTPNPNPVILDSAGMANVWLSGAPYKMKLTTATDVELWTVDDIEGDIALTSLALNGGSSLVGFIQSGSGAVGRTVQAKLRDVINVADYIPAGTNTATTDCQPFIRAAINEAAIRGGGTIYIPPGEYRITTVETSAAHFYITNVDDISIIGYGATLRSSYSTAVSSTVAMFLIDGGSRWNFEGLQIVGLFTRTLNVINNYAIGAFMLQSSSRDADDICVKNVYVENCHYFLISRANVPASGFRVRGVLVENCLHNYGAYGVNCQNNGDNFTVRSFRTIRLIRSYFVYGVAHHTVSYMSYFTDIFTDCVIAANPLNTADISVDAFLFGSTSPNAHASFESLHDPSTQPVPGSISNVRLNINDLSSSTPTTSGSVRFAYFQNGVAQPTSVHKLFDDIIITGEVSGHIDFAVAQATNSGLLDISNLKYNPTGTALATTKGFISRLAQNIESNATYGLQIKGAGNLAVFGSTIFNDFANVQLGYVDGSPSGSSWPFVCNVNKPFHISYGYAGVYAAGTLVAKIQASPSTSFGVLFYEGNNNTSPNTANAVMRIGTMNVTGRSINAAGTINASGADYAEYENNAGLAIEKGSVVGFKADGTLTLTFAEAVRFGVKSTNPSFVGGDVWNDRRLVDRVAYSGKVPVNVTGATPGGYIVAVDDNGLISGAYIENPTFDQYKLAVGRVNRILDDGRAEIAVIVH